MAPTEILAEQHAKTLTRWLNPLGISVSLHTSSRKKADSTTQVLVGTHALLYRELPSDIGLVIIDEQHRFGVKHRSQLLQAKKQPHLLSLTATPIPRTIALTLYAELDLSVLTEMPVGRLPVKTRVVMEDKRKVAENWIKEKIAAGGQVFVVCPLIEESEDDDSGGLKAVETEYERLSKLVFPEYQVAFIHGKMKAKDKEVVIQEFRAGKSQVLVATSVIEVGIDIPQANIMVIEGAERFGLAQLHQLRGRVGRGQQQSYCLLFPSLGTKKLDRLKHMETMNSGFDLANLDLKLRGPGDVYGHEQSGFVDMKLASLSDEGLITKTQQVAEEILEIREDLIQAGLLADKLKKTLDRLSKPN